MFLSFIIFRFKKTLIKYMKNNQKYLFQNLKFEIILLSELHVIA